MTVVLENVKIGWRRKRLRVSTVRRGGERGKKKVMSDFTRQT